MWIYPDLDTGWHPARSVASRRQPPSTDDGLANLKNLFRLRDGQTARLRFSKSLCNLDLENEEARQTTSWSAARTALVVSHTGLKS